VGSAENSANSWQSVGNCILSFSLNSAAGEIEVRCPNGEFKSCRDELRPLHLWDFSRDWFQKQLNLFHGWDFLVRWDYSQSEPWELVVEGYRVDEVALVE
jgi:hypothetical protein